MSKLINTVAGLVAAIGFGAASAQEVTYWNPSDTLSTKTRAEVHAEAVAARVAGQIEFGEATRFVADTTGSTKTRAQVNAEAREAQRLGLLSRGETNVVFTAAQLEQIAAAGARVADMPVAQNR